jgi:hypothetical protein
LWSRRFVCLFTFGFPVCFVIFKKILGLLSMYNREVLGKHAIVQHFIFSSVLPSDPASEDEIQRVLALVPVSAADKRLGPIAAEPEHFVPCCSDALKFPSTLAQSGLK